MDPARSSNGGSHVGQRTRGNRRTLGWVWSGWRRVAILGLVGYVAVGLGCVGMQSRFIFYPSRYPEGNWDAASMGLHAEDCWFTSADGTRLHGWFCGHPKATGTLLWCHGNAAHLANRGPAIRAWQEHLGLQVFIFDYRGYGRSQGSPEESGIYDDVRAAYDYLVARPEVDRTRLFVLGRSLGGAVGTQLALDRPCTKLILESAFTSIGAMARRVMPLLTPFTYLVRTKFDTLGKVPHITVPVMVLHGVDDGLVPFSHGEQIFAAAPEPKRFYAIAGAGHNNITYVATDAYWSAIRAFLFESAPATRPTTP